MAQAESQLLVRPRTATDGFLGSMRLAPGTRGRLWKGLERFANCGDGLDDFSALGRAFPSFWPAETENLDESLFELGAVWDRDAQKWLDKDAERPEGHRFEQLCKAPTLDWNPAFHRWFLFYRDILRSVWKGEDHEDSRWEICREEFLLGLIDYNEQAVSNEQTRAREDKDLDELEGIWSEILTQFPAARVDSLSRITADWKRGKLELTARSDFTRACFLLCRENWRARICPRCKMYFVARTPKQSFCGTVCSAGNRLASKRNWWRIVGAKRRASQKRRNSKRNRGERNRR